MRYTTLFLVPLVASCAMVEQMESPSTTETPAAITAPPPPPTARTVEDFDTTSAAERREAASPSGGGQRLGTIIASLGDPARPGFWLMTSLVDTETEGRIEFPEKGTGAAVTLIPSNGGSARASLAALRLLDAPLTDLSELVVYSN